MSEEKRILTGPSSPAISHDEHAKHLNAEGNSSDSEHKPYEEHGPGIDHHIPQDEAVQAEPELWWSKTRRVIREPLAEFFGVFILILFGDG
jgi:aquaglyceroporin related protein, other eukaryote